MGKYYLLNAFSLNMLSSLKDADITVGEHSLERARQDFDEGLISAVGHADTAAVFSDVLGRPVEFNRQSVTLEPGDSALVGQYRGPRLEEGATQLPEGATIQWLWVHIEY